METVRFPHETGNLGNYGAMAYQLPENELNTLREKERLGKQDDFNFSISGENENIGRIGGNAERSEMSVGERRKKKNEKSMREALELSRQIQDLQDRIETADKGIDAGNQLKGLIKSGEFDKNDPAHMQLLIDAGFDPNDDVPTLSDVDKKIEDWQKDKADAKAALKAKRQAPDAHTEEARAERRQTLIEAKSADTNIVQTVEEEKGSEFASDFAMDDDWMSFASEIDESPIKTSFSASLDFNRAAPDQNITPDAPSLDTNNAPEPVEISPFSLGG